MVSSDSLLALALCGFLPCGSGWRSGQSLPDAGRFFKKVFWIIAFLAFLVVLILVLHLLRGQSGHWYEMLAFFAFVFACGLCLGCLFAGADEDNLPSEEVKEAPPRIELQYLPPQPR